jgi:ornithine cyclodeaminase/alanine dehydrogenase-like protein (mu-crystallin family)
MRVVSEHDLARVLTYPALVAALHDAFRRDINVPLRHHHAIAQPGGDATLLLMPAWTEGGERFLGCKIVTVFPGNAAIGKPSVYANYILLSGDTGEPLAVIEGRALTARRTAAASALAAGFLARPDAEHLVMIGAGALAAHLVRAHGAVRPIRRVTLWNRTRARGEVLAAELTSDGIAVTLTDEREAAIRTADIISCATLSAEPLVRGAWLKPGAHVDLVGGYTPQMREADDEAVRRARVYVDTRAGALHEAGDVVDPIRRGVISEADIAGDLFDLCRGTAAGRRTPDEITLFKSVGTALEDLAAAMLVWRCSA